MTINQLKYALALQKHGSFRQAAEKLGITQPGLSLQIQKLEEHLNTLLFERGASPIVPTREGEDFLLRAREIVIGFESLESFSESVGSGYDGHLILGIIPTLAPFLVPLFIDDLQTDYPGFKLDIHELTTEKVVNGVRSGELDAGLISTPAELNGLTIRPLFYERFYLYSSSEEQPGVELELKNIDYKRLWLLNEGNCFRDQVNNLCDLKKIRRDKDFVFRSNSIDALIRIVDTKGGMTILPELTTLTLTEQQENNYRPIENKAREISVIARKNYSKERFVDKLAEYIRRNIPANMLRAEGLEVVDPGIRL